MIASLWTIEPAATEDGYQRARGIVSPEFVYHCDINNGYARLPADRLFFELIRNETIAARSLSVRHPNILHLIRMFQVPGPFSLPRIKEINLPPLIRKNLLQIPR